MRILITGASGYLAKTLVPLVSKEFEVLAVASKPWHHGFEVDCSFYDLSRDIDANRLLAKERFDAVINAAAVNPGGKEEAMESVNGAWPELLAKHCAQREIRLVHVSSDMVHDGSHAPYEDNKIPSAKSLYGRTKARGEQGVIKSNPQAVIVRTSLIYGLKTMDRGTAGFVQQLDSGKPVNLFSDAIRQPVWDVELSDALLALVKQKRRLMGLINIAGEEEISRLDFGVKMLNFWRQSIDNIQAVKAMEVAPTVPRDLRLNIDYAQSLGFKMTGVTEVLVSSQG